MNAAKIGNGLVVGLVGVWTASCASVVTTAPEVSADDQPPSLSAFQQAMYFHSDVQDAAGCDLVPGPDGSLVFPASVSNPAATCPDAFAWKQFFLAVTGEFWDQWAYDQTVWVGDPKPVCTSDTDNDCCFVDTGATPQVGYRDAAGKIVEPADLGGSGTDCPYIPGDWGGSTETTFSAGKPETSHNTTFLRNLEPGRVARQREAEVVYRNDAFVRYAVQRELYSVAGLKRVYAEIAGEAAYSAPYRPQGQGVSFPPDAIMFKVDWIPETTMVDLGYVTDHDGDPSTPPQDADNPYITMKMKVNTGSSTDPDWVEGLFYLAAVTGASKALPEWHWFAFEHVDNLGRCDFIGCNDSFGFTTSVDILTPGPNGGTKATFASGFIPPHTQDDQLDDGASIFDLGKAYASGEMTASLAALFEATGVGAGGPVDPDVPSVADPAWRSYRMKGTQTRYYSPQGYPTLMGQSITEGGFVNTSSCLSCHVQASTDADGGPGVPGIGASGRLDTLGITAQRNGAPDPSDYFDRGTTHQRAVQVDFVWGVLNAQ